MIRCDICHVRPAILVVPMFHGHGLSFGRPNGNAERMCRPCALAVLDKYPGPYIWPRHENGIAIWLEPHEVPAA